MKISTADFGNNLQHKYGHTWHSGKLKSLFEKYRMPKIFMTYSWLLKNSFTSEKYWIRKIQEYALHETKMHYDETKIQFNNAKENPTTQITIRSMQKVAESIHTAMSSIDCSLNADISADAHW